MVCTMCMRACARACLCGQMHAVREANCCAVSLCVLTSATSSSSVASRAVLVLLSAASNSSARLARPSAQPARSGMEWVRQVAGQAGRHGDVDMHQGSPMHAAPELAVLHGGWAEQAAPGLEKMLVRGQGECAWVCTRSARRRHASAARGCVHTTQQLRLRGLARILVGLFLLLHRLRTHVDTRTQALKKHGKKEKRERRRGRGSRGAGGLRRPRSSRAIGGCAHVAPAPWP